MLTKYADPNRLCVTYLKSQSIHPHDDFSGYYIRGIVTRIYAVKGTILTLDVVGYITNIGHKEYYQHTAPVLNCNYWAMLAPKQITVTFSKLDSNIQFLDDADENVQNSIIYFAK